MFSLQSKNTKRQDTTLNKTKNENQLQRIQYFMQNAVTQLKEGDIN